MRTKMGLLLYDYFSSLEEEEPTVEEIPAYMEFILKNFPNIQVVSLEDFITINHSGTKTAVNIVLVEEGVEMDLEEIFDRAWRLLNYYSSEETDYVADDFYSITNRNFCFRNNY